MPVDNLIPLLYSPTPNTKPLVNTRLPGEVWTNFADLQLGLIDAAANSTPLIAVRYFSPNTAYSGGDFVVQAGHIYFAKAVVPIGPFNATQWTSVATAADIAAAPYLPLAGGALTGPLLLAADPTLPLGAATKQYSDKHLLLTGGQISGGLDVAGTAGLEANGITSYNGSIVCIGSAASPNDSYLVLTDHSNAGWKAYLHWSSVNNVCTWTNGSGGIQLQGNDVQINGPGNLIVQQVITAAQLSTTGAISCGGFTCNSGFAVSRAQDSTHDAYWALSGPDGSGKGYFLWLHSNNSVQMSNPTGNGTVTITSDGNVHTNGGFMPGTGVQTKAGNSAAVGSSQYNINWTGAVAQLYINDTNVGTITLTSDYRIKKDIQLLGSMWERVKALNPISYTHKEYTPATHKDAPPATEPLIVDDDTERWGFVAHELQETLIQDAATGEKDSPTHLQSPNPWTVIATLTKALQEAMTRIEALEARAG